MNIPLWGSEVSHIPTLQWNKPPTSWCDSYNRFKTLNVESIGYSCITTQEQLATLVAYRCPNKWLYEYTREQQEYVLLLMAAIDGEI